MIYSSLAEVSPWLTACLSEQQVQARLHGYKGDMMHYWSQRGFKSSQAAGTSPYQSETIVINTDPLRSPNKEFL